MIKWLCLKSIDFSIMLNLYDCAVQLVKQFSNQSYHDESLLLPSLKRVNEILNSMKDSRLKSTQLCFESNISLNVDLTIFNSTRKKF